MGRCRDTRGIVEGCRCGGVRDERGRREDIMRTLRIHAEQRRVSVCMTCSE